MSSKHLFWCRTAESSLTASCVIPFIDSLPSRNANICSYSAFSIARGFVVYTVFFNHKWFSTIWYFPLSRDEDRRPQHIFGFVRIHQSSQSGAIFSKKHKQRLVRHWLVVASENKKNIFERWARPLYM